MQKKYHVYADIMFHSSTQRKYWTFKSESEVAEARKKVNESYRNEYVAAHPEKDVKDDTFFLTVEEERKLLRHYDEKLMKEICKRFNPPIPLNSIGTACQYVKRLYLRHSVMEYNPKLMTLAAIWLACKTEEFNISMEQYTWNISHLLRDEASKLGEHFAEKYKEAILAVELILIKELNFHLTVHNPFRPFEGFLIDVKTRFDNQKLENPELLRKPAKDYLYSSLFTDVALLFTPSQIALASMLSAASRHNIVMDSYVTDQLLEGQPQKVLDDTIKNIKKIRSLIRKNTKAPDGETARKLEEKLERCRNKENDPLTEEYRKVKSDEERERDEADARKWRAEAQRQRKFETDLLGF